MWAAIVVIVVVVVVVAVAEEEATATVAFISGAGGFFWVCYMARKKEGVRYIGLCPGRDTTVATT